MTTLRFDRVESHPDISEPQVDWLFVTVWTLALSTGLISVIGLLFICAWLWRLIV